jgi:hypothetical protein
VRNQHALSAASTFRELTVLWTVMQDGFGRLVPRDLGDWAWRRRSTGLTRLWIGADWLP